MVDSEPRPVGGATAGTDHLGEVAESRGFRDFGEKGVNETTPGRGWSASVIG